MLDPSAVTARMAAMLEIPPARFKDHVPLMDLVGDSFALVELVIGLQDEFGVDLVHDDLQSVRTVGDLVRRFQERGSRP